VFACICRAVTSDRVSTAIDNGAATVEAVSNATGACTGCGTCRDRIEKLIGERVGARPLKALQTA
jgi:bacterioferritin-associated ferredoxin